MVKSTVIEENEIFSIEIKGTRPLMMHSPKMLGVPKSSIVKSSEYDPEEEAKNCLYINPVTNKICVPSLNILGAFKKAATNMKKAGAGKKTLKDFVYSGLMIQEDNIDLPIQEFQIDTRPVVIMRARVLRSRPIFHNWGLKFNIEVLDPQTWSTGNIRELLAITGKYQGLLEFRPLFGTFEVVSMKNSKGEEIK
jgi:hypothetical protein